MLDNFLSSPDAESLPSYRMVLKLACVSHGTIIFPIIFPIMTHYFSLFFLLFSIMTGWLLDQFVSSFGRANVLSIFEFDAD